MTEPFGWHTPSTSPGAVDRLVVRRRERDGSDDLPGVRPRSGGAAGAVGGGGGVDVVAVVGRPPRRGRFRTAPPFQITWPLVDSTAVTGDPSSAVSRTPSDSFPRLPHVVPP